MISESELLKIIEECKKSPATNQNFEKLATFYIIYDHLYGKSNQPHCEKQTNNSIDFEGQSEFAQAIKGKDSVKVLSIFDELMLSLKIIQPRMYDEIIRKISAT